MALGTEALSIKLMTIKE